MNTTLALGILLLGSSLAQRRRSTWVSGLGNDANPCSRTAPCKTLAAAYGNTSPGGIINVIDAGGFGTLIVSHSIAIDGSESFASALATKDTMGFIINAGASDVVVLRNLNIQGGGQTGIRFLAGGKLYVEDCRIFGFLDRGIDFEPSGDSELFVKDTTIRNNAGVGIRIYPAAGGTAMATIDHCNLTGNEYGLSVVDDANVTIRTASHPATVARHQGAGSRGRAQVTSERLSTRTENGIRVPAQAQGAERLTVTDKTTVVVGGAALATPRR